MSHAYTDPSAPTADLLTQVAEYIAGRRWFAGKGRRFSVMHVESLPWLSQDPPVRIEIVTVQYEDGARDSYQIPLAYVPEREPDQDYALIGRVEDPIEPGRGTVVAYDAVYLKDAAEVFLAAFHAGLAERGAGRAMSFHVVEGTELPQLARVMTAADVKAYADAGGDQNPLHQDEAFARRVGFKGIIAHGMFTLGHMTAAVVAWTGDPRAVLAMSAQFRAPVFMGEEIVAGGRVKAVDVDRAVALIECWVSLERDGTTEWPIKRGEAEVLLEP